MNTAVWLALSAVVWGGSLIYFGAAGVGIVAIIAHVIIWQNHRIEVKLNRLLEEQNITVSDADLRK